MSYRTLSKMAFLHCFQMLPRYNSYKREGELLWVLILEVLNVCLLYGCKIAANVEKCLICLSRL